MYKSIFCGAAALFSVACWADSVCESVGKLVATTDESNWPGGIPYASCKPMPDDPSKLIMVMDDKVYIVDASTAKIVSSGGLGAIPNRVDSYAIDTGRYRLSPKTRAFGIRFAGHRQHYRRSEEYETMNLFIVEGRRIRVVMQSLQTSTDFGGTVCGNENDESTCLTHNSSQRSDIAIAKSAHHGYADLNVTNFSEGCDDAVEKDGCDNFDANNSLERKGKPMTVRFNGKEYVVPIDLQGNW